MYMTVDYVPVAISGVLYSAE